MKLEYLSRYLSPKSVRLAEYTPQTSGSRITSEDVAIALGYAGKECALGVNLYLAKIQLIPVEKALQPLNELCAQLIVSEPFFPAISAGNLNAYIETLCFYVWQDYSRDASSQYICDQCEGQKMLSVDVFTNTKHQRDVCQSVEQQRRMPLSAACCAVHEKVMCPKCRGKGVLSHACQCHGRGQVLDRKKTTLQGVPVYKTCPRCKGRGFSRVKFTTVLQSLHMICPVKRTVAYQRIKPFYEMLVSRCYQEERKAEIIFNRLMK